MTNTTLTGKAKLKAAVDQDIKNKSKSPTECLAKYEWVLQRAEHYAEKTGLTSDEIIDAWENQRNYWYMNYYQDANQPEIKGDNVRIFKNSADMFRSIKEMKFRCPACDGVSTDPYECNSGVINDNDKKCDWKVYGLFGALGKGAYIYIVEKVAGQTIFMPLAWEDPNEVISVEIVAGATYKKFSIMEANLYSRHKKLVETKNLSCDALKAKGIIKRSDSFKKAREWLNTKEGLKWVRDATHHDIF